MMYGTYYNPTKGGYDLFRNNEWICWQPTREAMCAYLGQKVY